MKINTKVKELGKEYEFEIIKVSEGINGFPENLKDGLSSNNFNSWAELQDFSYNHNLKIVSVQKKNEWELWENKGIVFKPFSLRDFYGEEYKIYEKEDEKLFVSRILEETKNMDFIVLNHFLKKMEEEVFLEFNNLEEGEGFLVKDGENLETIEVFCLSFLFENMEYQLALI